MHILFLGDSDNPLYQWLLLHEERVTQTADKITLDWCLKNKFDFAISYNYLHIIKSSVIQFFQPNRIINLHISYLPFNRGTKPNVWSWVEDTPNGVSIHILDPGIDTGNILIQKQVNFGDWKNDSSITLASTYKILQKEIQELFKENWSWIQKGDNSGIPQDHERMTFHYYRDLDKLSPAFINGWETPIREFIPLARKIISNRET